MGNYFDGDNSDKAACKAIHIFKSSKSLLDQSHKYITRWEFMEKGFTTSSKMQQFHQQYIKRHKTLKPSNNWQRWTSHIMQIHSSSWFEETLPSVSWGINTHLEILTQQQQLRQLLLVFLTSEAGQLLCFHHHAHLPPLKWTLYVRYNFYKSAILLPTHILTYTYISIMYVCVQKDRTSIYMYAHVISISC